jgi:hypothetical protein
MIRCGNRSLIISIKLTPLMCLLALRMAYHLSGKGLCGQLRQLRWGINGKLVIVEKSLVENRANILGH